MRKFILPAGEIILSLRDFEPLLCFRDEGVRGVVRDLVLLSSCPKTREEEYAQYFNELIDQYEQSVHLRWMENTFRHSEYASYLVERLLDQADLAVYEMVRQYFTGLDYEVDRKDCEWLGLDLITVIHVR